jgi:hypothetical protein
MIKELWRGRRIYTTGYPLTGVQTTGTAQVVVDLKKLGITDSIDELAIHVTGNQVVAGAGPGVATGTYNPEGLITLANWTTAPQAAGLNPINGVTSRGLVVDRAALQGAFQAQGALVDTAGTNAVDFWVRFKLKRDGFNAVKKGIEYAHDPKKFNSDVVTLVMGTRNQLFSGGTNTWDLTGLQIEIWADLDVDANPENIHATELFEQVFNISAPNSAFLINTLPAGCFFSDLYLVTESNGALVDTVLNNVDIDGSGRYWLNKGENNAKFIREVYTKEAFANPGSTLTGIYVLPMRDGLSSRAMDAVATPIQLVLDVNNPGGTVVRLIGRKIIPGGIKRTVKGPGGAKQVIGLPNVV